MSKSDKLYFSGLMWVIIALLSSIVPHSGKPEIYGSTIMVILSFTGMFWYMASGD